VLYSLPISFSLTMLWTSSLCSFLQIISLYPSSIQIFSTLCSETHPVYVPPSMSDTKFHTHTKLQAKWYICYILIVTYLDSRRKRHYKTCMGSMPNQIDFALLPLWKVIGIVT
jgi:hypothetical protein